MKVMRLLKKRASNKQNIDKKMIRSYHVCTLHVDENNIYILFFSAISE